MITPQNETPASGCNHLTGVNTQNKLIVTDNAASITTPAALRIQELAQVNQKTLLLKAADFAKCHMPMIAWKRQMKIGAKKVIVRFEWPGQLCVYDPLTGEPLATSAPGQPETLQKI